MRFLLYNAFFIMLVITSIDFCNGKKKKKEDGTCPEGQIKLTAKLDGKPDMSWCIAKECTKYDGSADTVQQISGGDTDTCAIFYESNNCGPGLIYKYTTPLDGQDLPECIQHLNSFQKCLG